MVLIAPMKVFESLTSQAQVVGMIVVGIVLCYGLTLFVRCRAMSQGLARVLNAWPTGRRRRYANRERRRVRHPKKRRDARKKQ